MTQRSNLGLLYCRQIPYHLSHQGRPMNSNSSQKFTNIAPLILVTIQKFISYNWMSTLTFVVVYFSFFDRKVLLKKKRKEKFYSDEIYKAVEWYRKGTRISKTYFLSLVLLCGSDKSYYSLSLSFPQNVDFGQHFHYYFQIDNVLEYPIKVSYRVTVIKKFPF